jgi:hypothetical protein
VQPFVAAVGVGEGIRRNVDTTRVIGCPQGGEVLGLPEEISRTVNDEAHGLPPEQQLPAIPANLCGTAQLSLPAAPAQQVAEELEFVAKSALLQ